MAKLLKWLEGAAAQINPFDNGADFNSVQRRYQEDERRKQQQIQQQRNQVTQRANQQLGAQVQDSNGYYGAEASRLKQELAKGSQSNVARTQGLIQSLQNRQKELSDGRYKDATAFKTQERLEPMFKQGKSFEDIAQKGGFSDREVRSYASQYHSNYGDKGVIGNVARGVGQVVPQMLKSAAGLPVDAAYELNQAFTTGGKAGKNDLDQINKDFMSGKITPEAAYERAQKQADRYTAKKVVQNKDTGALELKQVNVLEFGGKFAQQGIDTGSVLPMAGGIASGASKVAQAAGKPVVANGLAKAASTLTAGAQTQATSKLADAMARYGMGKNSANIIGNAITSNAKQSAMWGTAQTGADVAQGRGITPESLLLNYGADFAMGTLPEIGLGLGAPAIVKGGKAAKNTATQMSPELYARNHPNVRGYDDHITNLRIEREKLVAQGLSDRSAPLINNQKALQDALVKQQQEFQSIKNMRNRELQGGFIAGPLAGDFSKAKKQGLVFEGVDGKPRFEVDDSGASLDRVKDTIEVMLRNNPKGAAELAAAKNYSIDTNGKVYKNSELGTDLVVDKETARELLNRYEFSKQNDLEETIRAKQAFDIDVQKGTKPSDAYQKIRGSYGNKYADFVETLNQDISNSRPSVKKLSEVLDHPELYANYPELSNLKVRVDSKYSSGTAHYDARDNSITISPNANKKTILHEIQHAIQNTEGFAKGGSPKSIEASLSAAEAKELKSLVSKADEGLNGLPPKQQKRLEHLLAKGDGSSLQEYRHLAGEAEARAVEARMDMPMSERYKNGKNTLDDSLDVPKKDLIIRNEGKLVRSNNVAMSIDDTHRTWRELMETTEKPLTEYKVGDKVATDTMYGQVTGKITKVPNFAEDFRIKGNDFKIKLDKPLELPNGRKSLDTITADGRHFSSEGKAMSIDPNAKGASIPFMITRDMRQQLADLGYKNAQVDKMTPTQAWDVINSGRPDKASASDAFAKVPKGKSRVPVQEEMPQSAASSPTMGQQPGKTGSQSAVLRDSQGSSDTNYTTNDVKIKGTSREKNVPVMKQVRDGDTVTASNVNPNVKKGEKRYSVDEDGKLIEDKKGATSLFTDDKGRVTGFRVGKEYFSAKDLGDLESVNGYGSTLATMRRNIERSFDKATGDKVNTFLVDHQQAQATKMIDRQLKLKQGMQEVADDLGINFGVGRGKAKKISAAVQDFGEGVKTKKQLVDEFGPKTAQKIVNADKWFRKQYNTMLDEMNTTLTQYGYDPVPKRKNYYTHFQDESVWQKFGLKMQEIRDLSSPTMQDANPQAGRGSISNKLAGMSENTVPNKKFNRYALQRKGAAHTSDAFKAFELYMNPTLNNIYMTPSISRARVLARAIAQDADIVGKDANKTIVQIREWANSLAGKSNRIGDRQLADTMAGPNVLKALGWAQRVTGQNTIVGNLSTAVMQPIVLAQTAGKFGYKNTLAGLYQQASGAHRKAQAQSGFLRRRYSDVSPITASKLDRTRKTANIPLEVVEETASRATWNAAYNDALSQGLKGEKAIKYADVNTEKTLAGRSVGERPEAFRSKTAGLATMFQLEVNNFWQQTTKEMSKAQVAKTMVAMYGLNILLQEITGRQVGFNPIDATIDTYEETQKDRPLDEKVKRIGQRWAGEFVDNAPFVGMAANTVFGEKAVKDFTGDDSNAGRFGVASPIRTLIDNPWMAVSPVAGSQIKKTTEAIPVLMEGKLKDKDGKTLVNVPQTPENIAKGLAFGKGAIDEVNQYYGNLGKKKIDQKAVQNQVDSKAGGQSLEGLSKAQQEMVATAATPDRAKELREQYVKENQAAYKAEQTGGKVTKSEADKQAASDKAILKRVEQNLNKKTSANSKHLLKKFAKTETREKWFAENNDAEYEYYKAKYENDKANGEISKIEDVKRRRLLKKDEVGSKYMKDTRDLYSLSKEQILDYISNDKEKGQKLSEELLAYDRALYDAGLSKYLKFKNGLGTSTGGRKSSGRKSGGKGGSKAANNDGKKALDTFASLSKKTGVPKTDTDTSEPRTPQMRKAALKRYQVANNSQYGRPIPITTRKVRI